MPLLILGVTGENVTRMAAGEPLQVPASHLAAIGLPAMVITICYGKTEQDIIASMTAAGLIIPGVTREEKPEPSAAAEIT